MWRLILGAMLSCAMLAAHAQDQIADDGDGVQVVGVYDANYAQDFARCPQHFADGQAPLVSDDSKAGKLFELCYQGFASLYAGQMKLAWYSASHLTKERIATARTLPRQDSFRPETRLPKAYRANLSQYRGSGYDRGHLAPNGDMATPEQQYDSFSLVNIVPQDREHNRNLWRRIEVHTRNLTEHYDDVYVVTGTAFFGQNISQMRGIVVPTHLYKAVYVPRLSTAAVYLSPNDSSGEVLIVSVDEFFRLTGVKPFPSLNKVGFDKAVFDLDTPKDHAQHNDQASFWLWVGRLLAMLLQAIV